MGKTIYNCNHNYFEEKSLQSCYWAGFIAADGNISKNLITIALAEKDEIQLLKFKEHTNSTNIIKFNNKDNFIIKRYQFTSKKSVLDLKRIYNIGEKKSLTLIPPNITNLKEIDSFICGYIDGDGCINMSLNRKSFYLSINILGTFEILSMMKKRFEQILGKKIEANILPKKDTNIYKFCINSNSARTIFKHFYELPIYKLERKWTTDIYNYSINHIKKRVLEGRNTIIEYYDLFITQNLSIKEVMKLKEINYKNCFSYLSKVRKWAKIIYENKIHEIW